jgi:uncharacterized protein YbjT (DUF2867 family)
MLGREVCRRLTAAGKPVRALARATSEQSKVDELKEHGAEIVVGDVRDPDSLAAACRDTTTVISTVSSMPFSYEPGVNDLQNVDHNGVMNLVDAAEEADVEHLVYISFTPDLDFPLRRAKRAVEERLRESDLIHTILRASYFMEVWLSPAVGFDFADAKARIYGTGKSPISWIAIEDVAQFTVRSLDNAAARNATLEIGGPEALTQLEVVRIFEDVKGQEFELEYVPEEALAAQQQGATDPMQASFAGLMRCYAQGDAIDMEDLLRTFSIELTSVREYAERVLNNS